MDAGSGRFVSPMRFSTHTENSTSEKPKPSEPDATEEEKSAVPPLASEAAGATVAAEAEAKAEEPAEQEGDGSGGEEPKGPPTLWEYPPGGVGPFLVTTVPVGGIYSELARNMEPIEDVRQGCIKVFKTVMKMWRQGDIEGLKEILHPALLDKLREEVKEGTPGGAVLQKNWEVLSSQFVGYLGAADYRDGSITDRSFDEKRHDVWFPFLPVKRFGAIDKEPGESALARALRLYPKLEKRRVMRMRVVFQTLDTVTLAKLKKQDDWPTYRLLYETPLPGRVDINAFESLRNSVPDENTPSDGSEGLRHLRFFSLTLEKSKLVRPAQEDAEAAAKKSQKASGKAEATEAPREKKTVEQEAFFSLGGMLGQSPAVVEEDEYGWRVVDINMQNMDSLTFEPMIEHVLERGKEMMGHQHQD
ncbi:unnamed protein product, partial [Symbiodinium sp. KB8]